MSGPRHLEQAVTVDFQFLQSEWAYLTGATVTLLFIIDPFAAVPVYVTLTERFSSDDRRVIRMKAVMIALGLLTVFALTGMKFFELFGITLPAFQIAGGILLLILGLSQLNASKKKVSSEEQDEGLHRDDISVFPLATPILAGPGAISTVILLSTEANSVLRHAELLAAIALVMGATLLILRSSQHLVRVVGKTGLTLFSRLMGIVLTAIAVQFVLNGVAEALKLVR